MAPSPATPVLSLSVLSPMILGWLHSHPSVHAWDTHIIRLFYQAATGVPDTLNLPKHSPLEVVAVILAEV